MADFGRLFSKNFEADVVKIAKKFLKTLKKVLVYRVFEVEHNEKRPETKADLKKLMDKKGNRVSC